MKNYKLYIVGGYVRDKLLGLKSKDIDYAFEFDEDFIGTAYSYTSVILSFLKKEATLKYMRDFLVMYRIGNDNFSASGAAKRAKIDFDGFNLLFFKKEIRRAKCLARLDLCQLF